MRFVDDIFLSWIYTAWMKYLKFLLHSSSQTPSLTQHMNKYGLKRCLHAQWDLNLSKMSLGNLFLQAPPVCNLFYFKCMLYYKYDQWITINRLRYFLIDVRQMCSHDCVFCICEHCNVVVEMHIHISESFLLLSNVLYIFI